MQRPTATQKIQHQDSGRPRYSLSLPPTHLQGEPLLCVASITQTTLTSRTTFFAASGSCFVCVFTTYSLLACFTPRPRRLSKHNRSSSTTPSLTVSPLHYSTTPLLHL